jgi:hypothetical protein
VGCEQSACQKRRLKNAANACQQRHHSQQHPSSLCDVGSGAERALLRAPPLPIAQFWFNDHHQYYLINIQTQECCILVKDALLYEGQLIAVERPVAKDGMLN